MLVAGNKVRIKSSHTIRATCHRQGWNEYEHPSGMMFLDEMEQYCNQEFTIYKVMEIDGCTTCTLEDVEYWNWHPDWLYYMGAGVQLPEELFEL